MSVSIIVAAAKNGVIGHKGKIPWYLSADLKRFKALTMGNAVVMGRRTYESLPIRPLPGRLNVVVTRNPAYTAPGCVVALSLEEALLRVPEGLDVFLIGGAEIYTLGLPFATTIHLTRVNLRPAGDTFFPDPNPREWRMETLEEGRDEKSGLTYSYLIYHRTVPRR